jgi:8-oxo-dGTP pyrophosphatase MutT (NUDIX family)
MTEPRPSSTVIVLREATAGFEVLLGRRPRGQAFGGAWVFPGGVVDPEDHEHDLTGIDGPDASWRAAALREVAEEVGIFLTDPALTSENVLEGRAVHEHVRTSGATWRHDRLSYLSNWITPEGLPKRFDTRFFLAVVEAEMLGPISDELEVVEWMSPEVALRRYEDDEIELIMPTIAHLRLLLPFTSAEEADRFARTQDRVDPVQPRIVRRDGKIDIEIP